MKKGKLDVLVLKGDEYCPDYIIWTSPLVLRETPGGLKVVSNRAASVMDAVEDNVLYQTDFSYSLCGYLADLIPGFLNEFYKSGEKVDYLTLIHGKIGWGNKTNYEKVCNKRFLDLCANLNEKSSLVSSFGNLNQVLEETKQSWADFADTVESLLSKKPLSQDDIVPGCAIRNKGVTEWYSICWLNNKGVCCSLGLISYDKLQNEFEIYFPSTGWQKAEK